MYLTMLIIVNNNTKSCLVTQCLLEDEIVESYEWFLDCILYATNQISPICLFSDADPALIKAIASKISNTYHFHCIFHIQKNLQKNLTNKLGQDYKSFYKDFLHAQNSLFEDDFHHHWT